VLILYLADIIDGKLTPGDDASEIRFFNIDKPPDNIAFESHKRAFQDYSKYKKTGRLPDPNE